MESLTWLLTFAAIGTWMVVGFGLFLRPPRAPAAWSRRSRVVLWAAVWVGALVGGSWGPELWSTAVSDYSDDPAVGAPAERTAAAVRTPFAVKSTSREYDAAARPIRYEDRLTLQLPLALLAFFALVFFVRGRDARAERPHSRLRDSANDRPGRAGAGVGVVVLSALLAACGSESFGEEASRPERETRAAAWDTLVHLRVEPEDTLLYSANHLVGSSRGFWVLDRIGQRVAHFGWDGELRWYAGGRGAGPGEFANPRMLQLDRHDRVWVLDVGNHRITGFDPDGRMYDEVSLQSLDAVIHAFAVDEVGERFFGMVADDRLRPVAIDRQGRVESGPPIPVPDVEQGYGMALQGSVSGAGRDEDWVYAFTMGDGLFRMRGLELRDHRVLYPEWIPFPGVETREEGGGLQRSTSTRLTEPNFSATGVAVTEERILVPFHGETPEARRLVDVFDLDSGAYLETLLLPRRGRVGGWSDRLLLTWDDPAPEILVLRPR